MYIHAVCLDAKQGMQIKNLEHWLALQKGTDKDDTDTEVPPELPFFSVVRCAPLLLHPDLRTVIRRPVTP